MPVPDWWTRVLTTLALASSRALSQIGTPGHLAQQGVAISMERWRGTLHLDLLQVCLLDGMLCTVLSHLQCAGSGGRVTGAPNRAPLGIMWGPSWVETSHPQWGRRGSPGWGWGLPLGRETAQWRDAVTLKVTGTLETPLLLWWGDTTRKNSSSSLGRRTLSFAVWDLQVYKKNPAFSSFLSECLGGRTSTFVAQTEHVSFFARVSVTALLRVRERGSSKKRPGQQGGQNTEYNTVQYRSWSTKYREGQWMQMGQRQYKILKNKKTGQTQRTTSN